METICENY